MIFKFVSVRVCECVWMSAYACVGYSCVLMYLCMGLSEVTNAAFVFSRM